MRRWLILALVIVPALAAFGLSVVMLVTDYLQLVEATQRFYALAESPATTAAAMVAAATGQDMHRVNVFADGTWALLSAIWFTLGLLGWPRAGAPAATAG